MEAATNLLSGVATAANAGDVIAQHVAKELAQAITKAEPTATVVGKVSPNAYVAINAFQRDVFEVAFKTGKAICDAVESQRDKMRALIQAQYGATCPTYEQFRADRAALRVLALERGLVDDQWVRKPYNAAVKELYGELPVSMSEAAVAKRAARPAPAPKAKPGAKKGETVERAEGEAESLEQFIAKHGLAKVLQAAAHILATRRESKLDATTLEAVAKKYAA